MDQAERLRNLVKSNSHSQKPLARVITVTSGKGGVGKSNTSINLAIQLRKSGKRVIILDADFGLANIEIMFGAVPQNNLGDLLYRGYSLQDVITWGPMDIGLISGGAGITELSNLTVDNLRTIVQSLSQLDEIADIVIVDTGAGISDAVMEFLVAGGEVFLVTTPEPTSIMDSYSLLKSLSRHPKYAEDETKIKLIANKVHSPGDGDVLYEKLSTVSGKYLGLSLEYLGEVPEDTQLTRAVMQQKPVSIAFPRAISSQAYERIAAKLTEKPAANVGRKGMASFFSSLLRLKK